MGILARARKAVILVLAVLLVGWPPSLPAADQIVLEDVVARGFEVAVSITPVDLSLEMVGGDLRFLSRAPCAGPPGSPWRSRPNSRSPGSGWTCRLR